MWGLEDIQEKAEDQRYHHYLGDTTSVSKDLVASRCDPEKYKRLCRLFHQRQDVELIVLPEPKEDARKNNEGAKGESQ